MIRPVRLLAAIIAGTLAAGPAWAQFGQIGTMVNRAQSVKKIGEGLRTINEPEEVKLGGDLAGMLLGAAPLVDDPAKQAYVNRVGRWIALHSERPGLPWKFGIIDSDHFNAFSTPGGHVLITRGLFDGMRSESELAGVLAHEVAHVVRKHHLGALQKRLRGESFGEMQRYFSIRTGSGITDTFLSTMLNAGRDLYVNGLDHGDEYEADRMGVVLAARAGYSPYGLGGVLQTLTANDAEAGYALHRRSHPQPLERIARLNSAMGTRLDTISGLADDVAAFNTLRNPPPPPQPPAPEKRPARRKS